MLVPLRSSAGIDKILEALRESEFRFARQGSEVPFVATSWLQYRAYPDTDFKVENGTTGTNPGSFSEHAFSQGLLYPAYISNQDMAIIGENLLFDYVNVDSGNYPDQKVATITPIAAWLRQFNRKNLGAAFVTPMFSKQTTGGGDWGTKCFAGLLGMYWHSDTLQWVYGAVYENSFGTNYFYPYGGLIWAPAPKWSVALIFPWPTVAYAPNDRWLINLAAAPGGSAWVNTSDGVRTTYSFYTWSLTLGAAYRFYGKLWFYAGAGVSGMRSFDLNTGDTERTIKTDPGAVFTLAVQFRP